MVKCKNQACKQNYLNYKYLCSLHFFFVFNRSIINPAKVVLRVTKINSPKSSFGDPETQVYLTRLENDLVELLEASVDGTLNTVELRWSAMASVCVVMASGGYPGAYAKGKPISGLNEANRLPNTKVFHAGTARAGDEIVTTGGRVLGVTAWAKDLASARAAAYAAVDKIQFEGAQFRHDIASKALG
jgi:phosphoribosylamine--glycine ligase